MRWLIALILTLLASVSLPACQSEQLLVTSDNITILSDNTSKPDKVITNTTDNESSEMVHSVHLPYYSDLLVIKYDSDGNQVWTKRFGQSGQAGNYPVAANTDSDGNFYIAGYSLCENSSNGFHKYCTIKYDAAGNQLQVAQNPMLTFIPDFVRGRTIFLDDQGTTTGVNLYDSSLGFNIVRYDSSGKLLWSSRFQRPDFEVDSFYFATVDRLGNTYALGSKPIDELYPRTLLLKYDTNGNLLWDFIYADPSVEGLFGLAIDNEGNIYSVGSEISGSLRLVKFDANGKQVWMTNYSSPASDYQLNVIAIDPERNIYVACDRLGDSGHRERATIKFDSSGKELWDSSYRRPDDYRVTPSRMVIDGQGNVYVSGVRFTIKYDSQGRQLWVSDLRLDETGLALDSQDNVYVAGNVGIDGTYTNLDTFKLDHGGKTLWRARYSKATFMDRPSLITDTYGNVYFISSLSYNEKEATANSN